jgi:CheY-like chemotaxis protein
VAQTFDSTLMDCPVPGLGGLETTRRIRSLERDGRRTVIIAMTASAMPGDEEACLAAGMHAYITKPVRVPDLAQALERWLVVESDVVDATVADA